MDYSSVRLHVESVRNSDIPEEANKYLIAVVHHTAVTVSDIKNGNNITWIKAYGDHMVGELKSNYIPPIPESGRGMDNHIDFILGNRSLEDDAKVNSLDDYADKLIVLRTAQHSLNATASPQLASPEYSVVESSESSLSTLEVSNSPVTGLQRPVFDMSNLADNPSARPLLAYTDNRSLSITPSANLQPSSAAAGSMPLHNRDGVTRSQSEHKLPSTIKIEQPPTETLRGQRSTTLPLLQTMKPRNQDQNDEITVDGGSSAKTSALDSEMRHEDDALQTDELREYSGRPDSRDIEVKKDLTLTEQEAEHVNDIYSLSKITNVKHLEAMVKKALEILPELEFVLQADSGCRDVVAWLSQVDGLKKQAECKPTIVGFVGNTGSGKSSVINALLGEENLVPTSCMRACTAVVTELVWNEFDEPHRRYRAEVEFITSDEWRKELDILFSEILRDGKISRDASNSESEAGVAYAKVKAVYPSMTKEDIAEASMDQLLKVPAIKSHLGTTQRFISTSADKFYRSLQHFIDTKDNEDGERQEKRKGPRQPEWWPLIKRVRIYLKAEVLSTGAVLVDLPGVQDSNAARSAVADSYIKQCSDICVVAQINRAVDDKAAKTLLSSHFKRQMKFDGMLSNVTFICSKTDDISVTEAIRSLHLKDEIDAIKSKVTDLDRDEIACAEEIRGLQKEIYELNDTYDITCREFNTWWDLKDMEAKGHEVYAPRIQLSRKRKQSSMTSSSSKRRSLVFDRGDSDEKTDSELFAKIENKVNEAENIRPLTRDEIQVKLQELESTMQETEQKGRNKINDRNYLNERIEQIAVSKETLGVKQKSICIAARNEWSMSRIQKDYALGIEELDQECAEEDDADNFDPDVEGDYEQVTKSLPVFCVSSRAYQTLCNRLQADRKTDGFQYVDQTGIPQLKAHCMKMTERSRITTSRTFLGSTFQLLFSIRLWTSNDSTGPKWSDEERDIERELLTTRLNDLEMALDKATKSVSKNVRTAQRRNIQSTYKRAISAAEVAALPRAKSWGGLKDSGGLHWSTYKAVVRYDGGPYTSPRGTFDFNKDLVDPFEKCILAGWEKCFQTVIPNILRSFGKRTGEALKSFHKTISEQTRSRGNAIAGMGVIDQKLALWEQDFNRRADELTSLVSKRQKEANRDISPAVANSMMPVYSLCVAESGPGMFKRMKGRMESHVEKKAAKMFKGCTKALDGHLKTMRAELKAQMESARDMNFQEVRKDYMNVILGVQVSNEMTESERRMRAAIYMKVQNIDSILRQLIKDGNDVLEASAELMDKVENKVQLNPQGE